MVEQDEQHLDELVDRQLVLFLDLVLECIEIDLPQAPGHGIFCVGEDKVLGLFMGCPLDEKVRAVFGDNEILKETDILCRKDDDIDIFFHIIGVHVNECPAWIGIGLAEERDLGIEHLFCLAYEAADRFGQGHLGLHGVSLTGGR